MASWGNAENARNEQDMDSNGYKLKVRNTSGAYDESDWRVDIEETDANGRALRLDGNVCLKRGNRVCGYVRPDATDQDPNVNWLKINSENGDPDVEIGNGLTMESGNRVRIRGKNISIGAALDEQYRVGIAGSVLVGPSEGDLEAMRVDGHMVIDEGVKAPSLDALGANHLLNIGATQAGEVHIGRSTKPVTVDGHIVANAGVDVIGSLGATQDIGAEGNVFGNTLQSHSLDTPAAGTLQIGCHNADLVTVADVGVETQVLGSLSVQQDADLQGNMQVQGTLTGQGVIAASTLQGSSLQVNGAAAIEQTLHVGGQTTLRNHLTVEHVQGHLPSDITATGCIRADMVLYGAKLSVSNNATIGGDLNVAGEIHGGTLNVDGTSMLSGQTALGNSLLMNGHDLILGGTGPSPTKIRYGANPERIEFVIAGTVRFVIDKTGGHNV